MARSHGERLKTRHKFNKDLRARGFSPVSKAVQDFEVGSKVHIDIDPSVHKGMPYRRFQGMTGEVMGQAGSCMVRWLSRTAAKQRHSSRGLST